MDSPPHFSRAESDEDEKIYGSDAAGERPPLARIRKPDSPEDSRFEA